MAAAAPGSLWERKVDSTWFQALRLSTQAPLPLDPNAFPVLQDQRAGTGYVRSAIERWEGGKRKHVAVAIKRSAFVVADLFRRLTRINSRNGGASCDVQLATLFSNYASSTTVVIPVYCIM